MLLSQSRHLVGWGGTQVVCVGSATRDARRTDKGFELVTEVADCGWYSSAGHHEYVVSVTTSGEASLVRAVADVCETDHECPPPAGPPRTETNPPETSRSQGDPPRSDVPLDSARIR